MIFQQDGPPSSGNHFGCRIVQARDGNLFLTTGDHFRSRDEAQNLGNHLGKVIRVTPDGRAPPDNPFVKQAGARPRSGATAIATCRARRCIRRPASCGRMSTARAAATRSTSRRPARTTAGRSSRTASTIPARKIGVGTHRDGMEQPLKYWVPSIAPSGMAFYTGDLFPAWRGNMFVGALAGQMLVRLEINGEKVGQEERLLQNLRERIRDVRQGPDGALYLATDNANGRILRVSPGK